MPLFCIVRMVPSQPRLDVGKLQDERLAEEFTNRLSGDLRGLSALGDLEKLWSAFKTTVLDVGGMKLVSRFVFFCFIIVYLLLLPRK